MIQFPRPALPANTLPVSVQKAVMDLLERQNNSTALFEDFRIMAGGCINHGGWLKTSAGEFFVKWNDVAHLPGLFDSESKGLSQLNDTKTIRVPKIIGVDKTEIHQFIILEFLVSQPLAKTYWRDLGHRMAELHHCSAPFYGLGYDNYIGSLTQRNTLTPDWIKFFIDERISPQLMMAEQSGLTDYSLRKRFDVLFQKLRGLLPVMRPSLIHGDLWAGNVVADEDGNPCLIDPAVYFGVPEIEIAYTHLFGQFDPEFYSSYEESNPFAPGFEQRIDIYNLYPLLVHLNLFGRCYLQRIEKILNQFT